MAELRSISVGRQLLSRRVCGFSLVELIVVLGILSLVVMIIVPTVSGVKATSQRSDCAAALHNIGLGVWTYSLDNHNSLPWNVVYKGDDNNNDSAHMPFDTVQMASSDDDWMNLGLLQDYVDNDSSFYCPSQVQTRSPSIAYNSPSNKWKKKGADKKEHNNNGNDKHDGDESGTTPDWDLNSSFAARPLNASGSLPSWKTQNYSNRVIYSDFLSVDGWDGRSQRGKYGGPLIGPLFAPHSSIGYNRLFGDGSVRWVGQEPLSRLRPITQTAPCTDELNVYYNLLDVLP